MSAGTVAFDVPASFAQERLWILDRISPGSAAYHMPVTIPLRGRVSAVVLERCLRELARRHESLRTTFCDTGGALKQVIARTVPTVLTKVDLRRWPRAQRYARLAEFSSIESRKPGKRREC
jgi:Condensation domain